VQHEILHGEARIVAMAFGEETVESWKNMKPNLKTFGMRGGEN